MMQNPDPQLQTIPPLYLALERDQQACLRLKTQMMSIGLRLATLMLDKWFCLTSVIKLMMITSLFTSFLVKLFYSMNQDNTCLFAAFTQSTVFSQDIEAVSSCLTRVSILQLASGVRGPGTWMRASLIHACVVHRRMTALLPNKPCFALRQRIRTICLEHNTSQTVSSSLHAT